MSFSKSYSGNENLQKRFLMCLNFAAEAHCYQKRKDENQTPYINHPIGVAHIIVEEAGVANLELVQAGLLHDTVEDTSVTIEEIRNIFGHFVGDIVQEVTDDKALPKEERKKLQILHAPTTSPQGKIVKLADKLYNLRDLEKCLPVGWSEDRREQYFMWAFQVCEGLRGVCPKLEKKLDEVFKKKGLVSSHKSNEQINIPVCMIHDELKVFVQAVNFAAVKHSKNAIPDAEKLVPFINHSIAVAYKLSQGTCEDVDVLLATLLLEVVDKTDTKIEEIFHIFGNEVGSIVSQLSYDHSGSVEDQLRSQVKKFKTMSKDAKNITIATIVDMHSRLQKSSLQTFPLFEFMDHAIHEMKYELEGPVNVDVS